MQRREIVAPIHLNELEYYLLGLCTFTGGSGLIGLLQRRDLGTSQPMWLDTIWFFMLFVGGITGVIGLSLPDSVVGLLVERIAMFPIASGAVMYAVATAAHHGWTSAGLVALFGVAAFLRGVKITRLVKYSFPSGRRE